MEENSKLSYVAGKEESLSIQVYNVGYEKCKSNHKWGPGIRDFFLIHYIVSGKGCYFAGDKVYELSAGNVFVIYPYSQITYCADEKEPWEYYWVGFQGRDAAVLLEKTEFTKDKPIMFLDPKKEFQEEFIRIYTEKGNDECSKVRMNGYLFLLLSHLIERSRQNFKYSVSVWYSKQATEYISFNYMRNISVEEVADYVGISRSHLYRVFMASLKKSPIEYILELRIGKACKLLETSDLSVGAIGYSVGFEDSLYFSRMFKKITGISPKNYRVQCKKQ